MSVGMTGSRLTRLFIWLFMPRGRYSLSGVTGTISLNSFLHDGVGLCEGVCRHLLLRLLGWLLFAHMSYQIPTAGCTSVDLEAGVLRLEALLGKMSYMIHLRELNSAEGSVNPW